ncbi:hypothetical protein NDU88_010328 [Pleurodeles waltl]|uniref:Uncharacterized protein n=1 Tax=Pleurodeles waltl TaxID=8319 RepID=A0AAV7QXQ5_PLEWA|nr:hypothetical protein NDU88_010328 [Pleurodeles waltl]
MKTRSREGLAGAQRRGPQFLPGARAPRRPPSAGDRAVLLRAKAHPHWQLQHLDVNGSLVRSAISSASFSAPHYADGGAALTRSTRSVDARSTFPRSTASSWAIIQCLLSVIWEMYERGGNREREDREPY